MFEIVVWGVPEVRSSLTSVRNLLLDTPSGGHVRLGDVADTRITPSPAVIERESVSRYVDVAVGVAAGMSRDDVSTAVNNVVGDLQFPLEYSAAVLSVEEQPVGRLIAVALAALIGIVLLLQVFFGSWKLAALTFLAVPLALSGGLLGALVSGGTLSFGSYMALFAVAGLATRNGIQLLDRFRRLERQGVSLGPQIVLQGAQERVLPIVATALATALVFVPLLVLGSRAGSELLHPLAAGLVGGLLTSTIVNLVVLPSLYLRLGLGFSPAPERPDPGASPIADAPPGGRSRRFGNRRGAGLVTAGQSHRPAGGTIMHTRDRVALAAVLLVGVALPLSACGGDSAEALAEPVVVEQVGSSDLHRITLSERAAQRLDVATAPVEQSSAATVIPYAAVLYSPNGDTWAYVNPEGWTFVREAIVVDRIDGDRALLRSGPAPGTKVAVVGVQELYGAETGVGGGH